jgi:hypothetical protein
MLPFSSVCFISVGQDDGEIDNENVPDVVCLRQIGMPGKPRQVLAQIHHIEQLPGYNRISSESWRGHGAARGGGCAFRRSFIRQWGCPLADTQPAGFVRPPLSIMKLII